MKRSDRNIQWVETYCRVPEGRDVGKSMLLREWQRNEIRKIYDNPKGTRRAILSFGRKNGKTALSACLLLLHLVGPEAKPNSQLYSAAQSRDQAAILFGLAAKMVRLSPDLTAVIVVRDTAKQLYCPELGTLYRALSAEASTAYGLSPVFIVHDELGQVKGARSSLYEALETATGAQESPLSIIISTQAPTDGDLLSVLIDDAMTGADPRTVVSLYTADPEADPFDEESIRAANPAFGDFQNAKETLAMAHSAARMPAREAEFRNLILNQRVEAAAPFVSKSVWAACGTVPDALDGYPVYGGLDLSSVSDLTSLVLVGISYAAWNVHARFWLPEVGLVEKARQDRVEYDVWANQGLIEPTPGSAISYEWVAYRLREVFNTYNVRAMAFDRWGWAQFRPWLERAGFTSDELARFVPFGQGFQSMSPALRELETALLQKRVCHGGNPVLTMCAANSTVKRDPAGNRKLDKSKTSGRIDGMVALTMAVGVMPVETDTFEGSIYEDRTVLDILRA